MICVDGMAEENVLGECVCVCVCASVCVCVCVLCILVCVFGCGTFVKIH